MSISQRIRIKRKWHGYQCTAPVIWTVCCANPAATANRALRMGPELASALNWLCTVISYCKLWCGGIILLALDLSVLHQDASHYTACALGL